MNTKSKMNREQQLFLLSLISVQVSIILSNDVVQQLQSVTLSESVPNVYR